MRRIDSINTYRVTLDNPTLKTSYGSNVVQREHLFVEVRDDTGIIGFGEGSPLPHFSGERATEMQKVVEEVFAPVLLGLSVFDLETASISLDRALPHHQASKSALINALLDLQGKALGVPVHGLLGGAPTQTLRVAGAVGISDVGTVLKSVRTLVDAGIDTVKLKVGADWRREISILEAVRESFGGDLELRADANSGFNRAQARRFLDAARDLRLQYFEQPLHQADLEGMAELRKQQLTPIAVDESLFGLKDAMTIIRAEAADVFIVKLIKLGGLYSARKLASIAEAAGIGCVAVSPYETALGVSANIHLAASSTAFHGYAAELGWGVSLVHVEGLTDLVYDQGLVQVPTTPGLGVTPPDSLFHSTSHPRQVLR